MKFFSDPKHPQEEVLEDTSADHTVIHDGNLDFVREYAGNGSKPSYQEAAGAPVERTSPLGLNVGSFTVIFLNIGQMIGTGVFSTPATILKEVGSPGLSLIFWFIGFIIACCSLAIYLEFASYFPNRSGSEVVYLEQAYPRPRYLLPTAFAVLSVLLSFSSSNAIVASEYLFATGGHTPSAWQEKGLAVGVMTFVIALAMFNTTLSLRISNAIGIIKIITLVFISITGLVVLGGHTSVKDPHANFINSFSGTAGSGNGIANALVKVNFAYTGYANAFYVVGEINNPVKTLKRSAPASLLVVAVLYLLCNVAYFAAVPRAELEKSSQLAASLFFSSVFGSENSSKALNFLIALSAFGNILSVIIGSSRAVRECGRQGVLPYPKIWASTKPFGTPTAPYLLKLFLTILMILAPPAGDAFNFIVDLQSYPSNVFSFAMTFGLLLIRRRRARIGLQRAEFRVWNIAVLFSLAINVLLLVMPWYPPTGGRFGGDVSFWYATYCAVGLAILAICAIYWYFWIHLLPKIKGYQIRQLVINDGFVSVHVLKKIPNAELAEWDATHDVLGNLITDGRGISTGLDDKSGGSLRERNKGEEDFIDVAEKA